MAVAMLYAIVVGVLLMGGAWCAERMARGTHRATRAVWLLSGTITWLAAVAPLIPGAPGTLTRNEAGRSGVADPPEPPRSDASTPRPDAPRPRGRPLLVDRLRHQLEPLDHPLAFAWGASSALALLLLVRSARTALSLRAQLREVRVDGLRVLVANRDTPLPGPVSMGFPAAAILLPEWVLDCDEGTRALIVTHEQEHLRARDPEVLLLAALAIALVPWLLPLLWMRRRLRLAVEIDCDRRVLRRHPDLRRYLDLLLLTAERHVGDAVHTPLSRLAMVPLFPGVSHLTERITIMTAPRRPSFPRLLALAAGVASLSAVAYALPTPTVAGQEDRPGEIAGLYWMVPPDMPAAMRQLAPGREFTYLRLGADGRSRLENVAVDASGERVAPSTEVGPWSTLGWRVRRSAAGGAAQLCWQLGRDLTCRPYRRDAASGDLTLFKGAVGGPVDLVLRRAAPR